MRELITSALLIYGACLLFLYVFQRSLIYFPEKKALEGQQNFVRQMQLTMWPDEHNYRGLLTKPELTDVLGTVVVFHGNAGSANGRRFYMTALQALGYRVLLAEYPGYGARPGAPSEAVLIADALETVQLAYEQYGDPLYLWGESLGSGVVSGVIADLPVAVKGIVLMTPFDSLANTAQHHYGLFLAKWLVKDSFDNVKNLQNYQGRIAVLQADKDEVVPPARTQKLYQSLPGIKRIWRFPNASHGGLPLAPGQNWWREVMQFLSA